MTNTELKNFRKQKIELNRSIKRIKRIKYYKIRQREKIIYSKKYEKLKFVEKNVENYINSFDDEFVKRILNLRYIRLFSWEKTAGAVGGGNTADTVRMIAKRAVEKKGEIIPRPDTA